MPKIQYKKKAFKSKSLTQIEQANAIITEYQAQGFKLTLRQLYYQFVARDLLPNCGNSYKNLSERLSDARLAGLVDWSAIVDRTRQLQKNSHWDSPADVLRSALVSYRVDKWEGQPNRLEVWVEKDALNSIIWPVCEELDISHSSTRGYTSQTAMWEAAERIKSHQSNGQNVVILVLTDHDPSGLDMFRDIKNRLSLFGVNPEVKRIALSYAQVTRYNPPPNPTKGSDSRARNYVEKYGPYSWELDALDPKVLMALIREEVLSYRDDALWWQAVEVEKEDKAQLRSFIS